MGAADDVLLVDRTAAIATLTLNRPEALNSLTTDLKVALRRTIEQVADDDAIRVVVLTGSGRGFCAGQDLVEHGGELTAGRDALNTVVEHYNPIVLGLTSMPKPVIAAVNGIAAGAGVGLACAADLRVASRDARFMLAFANVGLGLDTGLSWTLPRLIGSARARAMALLADTIDAEAALTMGLVNAVVEPDLLMPAAYELAARLATGPTAAYGAIKQQLDLAADSSLAEALDTEARLQSSLGHTADHQDAVSAFMTRQKPTFTGR